MGVMAARSSRRCQGRDPEEAYTKWAKTGEMALSGGEDRQKRDADEHTKR